MAHSNNSYHKQDLISRWQQVNNDITTALINANRNEHSAKLIAVSKTKPLEMIVQLAQQGQKDFGENYLQEALAKINTINSDYPQLDIVWHYIGSIQRNKTRDIAENFAWVHTVERDIIAQRLNDQRPNHLPPLNVLIQVNIDNEESKSGCNIDEVAKLVEQIITYKRLQLRGLMIIPAQLDGDNQQAFARTQELFNTIKKDYPQLQQWDTLSMGMSGDMASAIEHGSTMVRVGTAIFGSRG